MTNTKKKKGNKMKLLSAVGMLTVSAAMLVSSTFAWFSMNKEVTAQTMNLQVKSDSTYLLIGTSNTASTIQTTGSTNVTFDSETKNLIPCNPAYNADKVALIPETTGKNIDGDAITTAGTLVNTQAKAAAATNWYTATANTVDAAAMKAGTARQLTTEKFANYVYKTTVYLTVAAGANDASQLTVSANFDSLTANAANEDLTAARVLIATSDNDVVTLSSASTSGSLASSTITDNATVAVDIYFYFDGDDSNVYTNNTLDLTGTKIELTFNAEPVTT